MFASSAIEAREVEIFIGADSLQGMLVAPPGAVGVVLFAHGSGSSHLSPRNRRVAADLQEAGLATLLFDLLTEKEEDEERHDAHLRFDIGFLAQRLEVATDWALRDAAVRDLPIGYFGASTGAAAALVAAAAYPETVKAVVSRGGRPDLAGEALARVVAPTLLIVGREDTTVLRLNQQAMREMSAPVHLETIRGATHLLEEPGALEEVSRLAADWFRFHLGGGRPLE